MAFGRPETVRPNEPKQSEASKNIPFLAKNDPKRPRMTCSGPMLDQNSPQPVLVGLKLPFPG
jgi:hypothetical protein